MSNRDANKTFNFERDDSITSTSWHSDVSYEKQPPGLTALFLVSTPTSGGDTVYASQVSTLKKLSPQFVAFLRTLKAVHSGVEQAEHSRSGKRGGIVRREPVETVHPVVRRHPVTGEEALYVNRQFTRRIVGLKREESGTRSSPRVSASYNVLIFVYRKHSALPLRPHRQGCRLPGSRQMVVKRRCPVGQPRHRSCESLCVCSVVFSCSSIDIVRHCRLRRDERASSRCENNVSSMIRLYVSETEYTIS